MITAAVLSVSTKENISNSSGTGESITDVSSGTAGGIIFGSESPLTDVKGLNKSKMTLDDRMTPTKMLETPHNKLVTDNKLTLRISA